MKTKTTYAKGTQIGVLHRWNSRTQLKRGIEKCLRQAAGHKAEWSLIHPGGWPINRPGTGYVGCKFHIGEHGDPRKNLVAIVGKFSPVLMTVIFRTIRRVAP